MYIYIYIYIYIVTTRIGSNGVRRTFGGRAMT